MLRLFPAVLFVVNAWPPVTVLVVLVAKVVPAAVAVMFGTALETSVAKLVPVLKL
jgi:hypothetical protein